MAYDRAWRESDMGKELERGYSLKENQAPGYNTDDLMSFLVKKY